MLHMPHMEVRSYAGNGMPMCGLVQEWGWVHGQEWPLLRRKGA